MSDHRNPQAGFTLIELLVVMALFSVLSVGFYQVMFAGASGSDTAGDIVQISEEARLGLNRMVRDTRETEIFASATATSFHIQSNFDGDNQIAIAPTPGAYGEEDLTFAFDENAKTITLNGQLLIAGVDCIRSAGVCVSPVFDYVSNELQYDWNRNGVTTWQEIDAGPSNGATVGNGDGILNATEKDHIDAVTFNMTITSGDRTSVFRSRATMRNLR